MSAPAAERAVPAPAPAPARARWPRALGWLGAAVLALALLVPAAVAGYVWRVSLAADRTPSDVVLVLGAAQFDGRPSPVLASRLEHASLLYADGVAPRIMTVGGKQPGDRYTEAGAGKRALVADGVPASDIVVVGEGADTIESLTAAARVMAARGWSSATLVTDPAHEARSLAIARRLGIDARTSPTTGGDGSAVTGEYVVRETAGLLWFWTVGRWSVPAVVGKG